MPDVRTTVEFWWPLLGGLIFLGFLLLVSERARRRNKIVFAQAWAADRAWLDSTVRCPTCSGAGRIRKEEHEDTQVKDRDLAWVEAVVMANADVCEPCRTEIARACGWSMTDLETGP